MEAPTIVLNEFSSGKEAIRLTLECVGRRMAQEEAIAKMLEQQLQAPTETQLVPINDVLYTHDFASGKFRHGDHAGREVMDIVDELYNGKL